MNTNNPNIKDDSNTINNNSNAEYIVKTENFKRENEEEND